jgi:photosystem II stability/assembly factor-like uncharacterized protein
MGTPRARRAVPLVAAALTAVVVAGLLWLRVNGPTPGLVFPMPSPTPLVSGDYQVGFDFASPTNGWAVITSYNPGFGMQVFKTTDAARHWTRIYAGPGVVGAANIQFVDPLHGFISSIYTAFQMFRTSDGGMHWQEIFFPRAPLRATFVDPAHGWFLSFQGDVPTQSLELFATTDGGATWVPRSWPSDAFPPGKDITEPLNFRSNCEGWVGGVSATPEVRLTTDGGGSWTKRAIPLPPFTFASPTPSKPSFEPVYSVTVRLPPQAGVIAVVGRGGTEQGFMSLDQGQTWRAFEAPNPATYSDITYLDASHWWAFRFGFLFKTSDAGMTWRETHVAPLLDGWRYSPAYVIDANRAWSTMSAIGRSGWALSMTSDGGASWHMVSVPQPG